MSIDGVIAGPARTAAVIDRVRELRAKGRLLSSMEECPAQYAARKGFLLSAWYVEDTAALLRYEFPMFTAKVWFDDLDDLPVGGGSLRSVLRALESRFGYDPDEWVSPWPGYWFPMTLLQWVVRHVELEAG